MLKGISAVIGFFIIGLAWFLLGPFILAIGSAAIAGLTAIGPFILVAYILYKFFS